ncbi:MAG: glucosaminidase domain-containing protein [Pseudomonadales bacterium]|nr:glucosaminidase domain-containing protein [Pseudomonadales bacterium]
MAKHYRVSAQSNQQTVYQLLDRIDAIPQSLALALAQASIESAWGTSRFATQGNNYFGQWCFTKGCGLIPLRRTKGMTHEVRLFDTPSDSIRGYIANLNSHPAYKELRAIRRENRDWDRYTSGCELTTALRHYSQQRLAYVETLKAIIRVNQLEPAHHIKSCKRLQRT